MGTRQLTRRAVVSRIAETTEYTFLDGDQPGNSAILLDGDTPPQWPTDPEILRRNPARAGLSPLPPRITSITANPTWQYPIQGTNRGAIAVTSISTAGVVVTASAHNLRVGQTVALSYSAQERANGAHAVTAVTDSTTFTIGGAAGASNAGLTESALFVAPVEHEDWIMSGHRARVTSIVEMDAAISGTPIPGETFTQGTTATLVFIRDLGSNNALCCDVKPLAGQTIGTGNFVGNDSGAIISIASAPEKGDARGVIYSPWIDAPSFSVQMFFPFSDAATANSHVFQGSGMRANMTLSAADGDSYLFAQVAPIGKMHNKIPRTSVNAGVVPTGIPYPTHEPEPFNNLSYRVMDATSGNICNQGFQFSTNNGFAPDKCDNTPGNLKGYYINSRAASVGQFSPQLNEDYPFWDAFNDRASETLKEAYWKLGSTTNNIVEFWAPNVAYTGYGTADREGVRILELPYELYGAGGGNDNEYWIEYR